MLSFQYDRWQGENCQNGRPELNEVAVLEDSTIDISGVDHFIKMPDIGAFAKAGFPFTRFADLAETLAVLPEVPTLGEITTLLNTVGHLSAETGYPAYRLQVKFGVPDAENKNYDLLLIGEKSIPEAKDWTLPALAASEGASMSTVGGYESPLSKGRSVVFIAATDDIALVAGSLKMIDFGQRRLFGGDRTIIRGDVITQNRVGATYELGRIPYTKRVWIFFAERPYFLIVLAILTIIVSSLSYGFFVRRLAKSRLGATTHG
jgi:hypothetical protein